MGSSCPKPAVKGTSHFICVDSYEETLVESKARAAQEAGLGKPFIGNLTLYLTPLHILFLVCYAILCIDSFVYGVLSKAVRKKLKLVILR